MPFGWPNFDRNGKLDQHYKMLLFALGLLDDGEDMKAEVAQAEARLAEAMSSFMLRKDVFSPVQVMVESGKFKTAAFFFAMALEKDKAEYELHPEDIFRFLNYMTQVVTEDAEKNPGKHSTVDAVLSRATITITCNLAKVA